MYKIFVLISVFFYGIAIPTLSAHGDLPEQIDRLTKEIELAADNANLYVQRGQLYAQHQEYPAAIGDFRKARQLQTDLFLTDLLLAKVFATQKHPKIALSYINTFLTTQPIHIDGLIIRAGIYQQLGKNVAAQKDFEQAIRHNKQVQPKHYIAIAENFLSADASNINPALEWLAKGQAQFGFDIVLKEKEVDLLIQHKLYNKAIQCIDVILTHFQRKEKWLFQKGQIFEKSLVLKQAVIQYEATLTAIAQLPKRVQMTKQILALEANTIERLQVIKKDIGLNTSDQYAINPSIDGDNLHSVSPSLNTIPTSSPLTFDDFLPNNKISSASLIRGPYLQSGTPTSTVIKWRTNSSTDSKVWYGNAPTNLNLSKTLTVSTVDHEVMLDGLTPNTTYYYAIGDNSGQITTRGNDFYFKTAPTTGTTQSITAWILGDCGTADSNQSAVRDAYYNYIGNRHTDMILLLGDNAYASGLETEYQNAIFNMYPAKLKNTMMWSCPGNHEYLGAGGLAAPYYDIFTFPTNAQAGGIASNTEKYYSFDYGNIHIISLDSHDESRSPGSPMLTWLANDLAATNQEWIVVIFHHPSYSKGSHDSDTEGRMIEMRVNVLPILESYGVDLVLSGHSHAYERSRLINGHYGTSNTYNPATHNIDGGDGQVTGTGAYQQNDNQEGAVYIVTGSAGKRSSLRGTHAAMHYVNNNLGSTILEVNGGQMDIKFLNSNGTIEDYLTLLQTGTPSINWVTPVDNQIFTKLDPITFEALATDGDGTVNQVEFFANNVSVGVDTEAPYAINWTPTDFANYTLKAVATDNEMQTQVKEITIEVQQQNSFITTRVVDNSSDDAEERVSDGNVGLISSDLELVDEGGISNQVVGIRFNPIGIPKGATITNAYIQFTTDESDMGTSNLTLHGQAHSNAPTFSTAAYNISNRTKTTASINWNPADWITIGETTPTQQTPDLSTIIQEIVNQSDWAFNNSLAIIITGTGERTAESYDGAALNAPTLHLTFDYPDLCDGTNLQLNGNPMTANRYKASETITATATIDAGKSVTFLATQSITLTTGFHTKATSNFLAKIQPVSCSLSSLVPAITAEQRTNSHLELTTTPLSDNLQLQVYPNPTNDFTTVRCYLPQPSAVQMQIVNGQGQVITQMVSGHLEKGWYQRVFEIGNLVNGVYYIRIQTEYGVLSERVLVVS